MKETLEEIVSSVKTSISERMSSPFGRTYLIIWFVTNYKLLLYLFSDLKVQEKIDSITNLLESKVGLFSYEIVYSLWNASLLPLLLTITYLYLFPWPTEHFYRLSQKHKKELKLIKNDNELITKEEKEQMLKTHHSEIEKLLKENRDQKAQIESLSSQRDNYFDSLESGRKELDQVREEREQFAARLEKLRKEHDWHKSDNSRLTHEEMSVLRLISSSAAPISYGHLLSLMSQEFGPIGKRLTIILEGLIALGYVSKDDTAKPDPNYLLTRKGIAILNTF